jgi:hypothetical protein
MVVSRNGLLQAKFPLIIAYEHITDAAWACWVAAWNAGR